jgi:acyl carrier protein
MDEVTTRLSNCFQVVFPELPNTNILAASQDSIAAWDSVAAITLVSVIEEEFGIEMDLDALAEFDSFVSIRGYVNKKLSA